MTLTAAQFFYLFFLIACYCGAYLVLGFLFNFLFDGENAWRPRMSLRSIAIIAIFAAISFAASISIGSPFWSDRLLHTLGGGVAAFLICFLVVRDLDLQIGAWKFAIISFLCVTSLGVGNELAEFFLQHFFGMVSAATVDDTWWDLLSNLVGSIIGAAIFSPFVREKMSH